MIPSFVICGKGKRLEKQSEQKNLIIFKIVKIFDSKLSNYFTFLYFLLRKRAKICVLVWMIKVF